MNKDTPPLFRNQGLTTLFRMVIITLLRTGKTQGVRNV
uniref:Uncharacterized protein n=1 Tax=Klebsiella phage vB_KpnM_Iguana_ER37 TaxID=3076781 RepID=A0AB38Z3U3_9CAUD|nr:MAG TPA: hypothetical protein [Caudoviricetes sp.]